MYVNNNFRRAATVALLTTLGLASCGGSSDGGRAGYDTPGDSASGAYSDNASPNQRAGQPSQQPPTDYSEDSAAAAESDDGLFSEDAPVIEESDVDRTTDNTFEDYGYRSFIETEIDPVSTFSADVDTGSYSIARRWLDEGDLPPIESVRPEEYINALRYDYEAPEHGLGVIADGGPSPFDSNNRLVRIGIQGETVAESERLPVALTFVVDTSGSMDRDDRLGLVKESLAILVDGLKPDDTVAIVTYDDSSGVVLQPTPISNREEILDALDRLRPGGSTNLEAGLQEGYSLARNARREGGINRVILVSDGVANQGITDPDALSEMIRDDADSGINLVTVGFGMGNYNDVTMEQLADQGDGFYAYVDTIDEARRIFEDDLTSTLVTIAKDAKIQVEFNPETVLAYRLIGFENRGIADRDFDNDEVDAGELGSGHQVTAVYELKMVGSATDDPFDAEEPTDAEAPKLASIPADAELGTVRVRWADPDTAEVTETDQTLRAEITEPGWSDTDIDYRVAVVTATFAEKMRDNPVAEDVSWDGLVNEARRLADDADREDVDGLRDMIEEAAELQ